MNFPDYDVVPFTFVVASTTKQCPSLQFVTNVEFLNVGKFGYTNISLFKAMTEDVKEFEDLETETKVKGFLELLHEYKWYEENGWETDKEIEDAGGVFYLGSDFKRF